MHYLVTREIWQQDKERKKVINKLLKDLQTERVSKNIKDNDLEFIKTFQYEESEKEEVQFARSDGSTAQITYNSATDKQRHRERQKRHEAKLREYNYPRGDH